MQAAKLVDELLEDDEVAEELHNETKTLANWRTKRIGPPFIRVGKRVLYRRSDLEKWLESKRVECF